MTGFEQILKRAIAGLNPWIPLFAFIAAFQFMRGAYFDAIYFSAVVIILLVDWKKIFPFEFPSRPKPPFYLLFLVIGTLATILFLVPRQSPIEVSVMIGLFLVGVGMVWYRDFGPAPELTKQLSLSKWLWIVLAVLMSMWELFAYILSDISSGIDAYPTISVLMIPFMASPFGQITFLLIWFAIGLRLLSFGRRK